MRILGLLLSGFVIVTGLLVAATGNAIAGGNARSERDVGMAYYRGEGRPRDAAKAVEHLARAVELGDAESAIRLGKIYEYGMSVTANETEAALWYTRGAELGDAQAQFEASIFYYKGRGVARDPVEAVKWWTLAMGHPVVSENVRANVASAEAKLSPDEISRGRALAQDWLRRRTPSPARTGS